MIHRSSLNSVSMCLVDFELKKDGQIAKALYEEHTFFHEQILHPLCVQDYTITERKLCVTSENVSIGIQFSDSEFDG